MTTFFSQYCDLATLNPQDIHLPNWTTQNVDECFRTIIHYILENTKMENKTNWCPLSTTNRKVNIQLPDLNRGLKLRMFCTIQFSSPSLFSTWKYVDVWVNTNNLMPFFDVWMSVTFRCSLFIQGDLYFSFRVNATQKDDFALWLLLLTH